jgi:hypothetical protein
MTTTSDSVRKASYAVAELVALKMKPHRIAEPAGCEIVNIMFVEEYDKDFENLVRWQYQ